MSRARPTQHRNSRYWEQNIPLWRRMCCGGKRRMLAAERWRFRPSAAVRNPQQGGCTRFMGIGDHPARRLERRWATRYSFRADLEIEWGSAVLRGSTRDISTSGMFIEAVDPLWVGAGFTARLTLERPVSLNCFVKRIEPGKGMGVSVAVSEPESQKLYENLFSSLSTTSP